MIQKPLLKIISLTITICFIISCCISVNAYNNDLKNIELELNFS